jgi:hypothetical protein
MGYSVADAAISGLSILTLCSVFYLIRDAFKNHHMNIFSYLMVTLAVFALISKFQTLVYSE